MKQACLAVFGFVLFFLVFTDSSHAQDDSSPALYMEALVEEAMAGNPSLIAARHEQEAAGLRVRPAGSLPDPMVMLGIMAIPVDTFALDQTDMTQKIISVTQPFPFPGKLKLAEGVARSDAESAKWRIRMFEDRLAFEVRRAFLDWANAMEEARITERNIEIIAQFAKVATARYSVGKGAQWDILRAQVEHSRLTERLATITQNIESTRARMASMLGRDEKGIQGTPQVEWTTAPELDEEELIRRADENNPTLAYLRTMVERADNATKLARRNRLPNFSVTLTYGQRENGEMNGMTRERPDFLGGMVGVQVPIYAGRKQIPLAHAAENAAMAARKRLENQRLRIHADLRDRIYRIRRADEVEVLYRTGIIPQAQTTVQSALASYQVNKVDFLTLLTSELNLMKHELDYFRMRIDREIDIAALALLLGEKVVETDEGARP